MKEITAGVPFSVGKVKKKKTKKTFPKVSWGYLDISMDSVFSDLIMII